MCTKERTAVPMLHNDQLKMQLKRVIRNTQLTGTYESVTQNQKTLSTITAPLLKNTMDLAQSFVQDLQNQSSLQSKYTRTSNNVSQQLDMEEEEREMREIKHLPKAEMEEATLALFTKKVKQLTYPKNPSLFADDPQNKKRQRKGSPKK